MARKKEKGILINGLDINHIVEKSRPLVLMRAVEFTLGELKILDTYLSRINARDPNNRTVRFTKEEYEQLMDIKQARPEDLEKAVGLMMKHTVTIPLSNGEWEKYTLFCKSSFKQDKKTGQWWVELTCTDSAKELFFNIEKLGYLRYQLQNVLALSSKYSVFLYVYLLANRYRKQWITTVEDLKNYVFQCSKVETYTEYKRFKELVLGKALKEVNEKTDIEFTMKPIRSGRVITDIEFTLVKDEVFEYEPYKQLTLADGADGEPSHYSDHESEALEAFEEVTEGEFTESELELLHEIMRNNDYIKKDFSTNSIIWGRARYLQAQYVYMTSYAAKNRIKHRFNYLKKAVQEDYAGVLK
jgi:plasmid replication initiation protein